MNLLVEAERHCVEFEKKLHELNRGPLDVEGPVGNFAAVIVPRLQATYSAMVQLLNAGHHDQMVVLFRRQLEDSLRLHYLFVYRNRADALVLGFQIDREQRVLRQLDRAVNRLPANDTARASLIEMVALRRERIKETRAIGMALNTAPENFPALDEMAVQLGRQADLVPYASAAEVSHSAMSTATEGYTVIDEGDDRIVRLVSLTSANPKDRVMYARAAINSTGLAVNFGLLLLNQAATARSISLDASAHIVALQALASGA